MIAKYDKKCSLRRAGLGAAIAGLLGISSCTPVPEAIIPLEQRLGKMSQLKIDYTNYIAQADAGLQESIRDNVFSADERARVYGLLSAADNSRKEHSNLARGCAERLEEPDYFTINAPWHKLLEKNVAGFDGNPPALQAYLASMHPGISVEAIHSQAEISAEEVAEDVADLVLDIALDIIND